jgi:hypothetical protein
MSCDGFPSPPPCAESPFARNRCYLFWHDVLHHVGRRYPSFIAHTGSCAGPKPSCLLPPSLGRQVFAGCCRPLLGGGPSRRYLCNPYMVAWTLTPRRFSGAFTRFFPENIGLTLDLRRSARRILPHCNFSGPRLSRLQSFHHVQAPMFARPPGCSHRCESTFQGRPGRLHHAMDMWLPT